jgi:hypothetical protein
MPGLYPHQGGFVARQADSEVVMSAIEVMVENGILRPAEVVELAARARLDLACACVLLVKESEGGRNVWGSDPVETAGTYTKGGAVTRDNYLAYRAAVQRGIAGRQGCGPTQLTYGPFQDQADAAGGCWDWRANVLTGFNILASLIRVAGEEDGFRRYNGSGPMAERYKLDAMNRLRTWRSLLAGQSLIIPEVDVPLTADEIERIARRTAELVWQQPVQNVKGEWPSTAGVLVAAEGRAWDTQDRVYDILNDVRALPDALTHSVTHQGVEIDLDALADRIIDRMAARMGGT